MPKPSPETSDTLVFRVAELFLAGRQAKLIAEQVNSELPGEVSLTRESIYPLLRAAHQRGFLRLVPPLVSTLSQKLAERFSLDPTTFSVVHTSGRHANALVAAKAAELVLDKVREVGRSKRDAIGLGLGPGRATRDLCRELGVLLKSAYALPKLRLFAIAAGCPVTEPEYSPLSFFNLLPDHALVERKHSTREQSKDRKGKAGDEAVDSGGDSPRIGLFSEAMLPKDQFEALKTHDGPFRQAYQMRGQIDIVVSSMGSTDDEHDLYKRFLLDYGQKAPGEATGNVMYRPFSETGILAEHGGDLRVVSLFDLEDFRDMATRRDKHVILIARQCGACGKTHARALRPLLTIPELRVWSSLVLDVATADELLRRSS